MIWFFLSWSFFSNGLFFLCRSVFARLAPLSHLKVFRDELLVFMKHFLHKRGSDKGGSVQTDSLISQRITAAEQAMRTGHLS